MLPAGRRRSARDGRQNTYYFAPPADPLNPYITPTQAKWLETFGRANAARFDARGFAYFIREVYDSFYPGYGESWPIYQGAVGMTYEQASARGLAYKREDGTTLTYRDGIVHHFNAGDHDRVHGGDAIASSCCATFAEYRRSALTEGEKAGCASTVLRAGQRSPRWPRGSPRTCDAGHRSPAGRRAVRGRIASRARRQLPRARRISPRAG